MQIFVHSQGQKRGPLPLDEVNRLLQAGQFFPDDLAWHEGLSTWIPLRNIQGVVASGGFGGTSPVVPAVPLAATPVAPVAASRTDALAICSLIFGIVGILCCFFLLPSLAAVICGHLSLVNLRNDPLLEGRGLAIAGLIMGYLSAAVGLIYVIFVFGLSFVQVATEAVK